MTAFSIKVVGLIEGFERHGRHGVNRLLRFVTALLAYLPDRRRLSE